MREEPKKITAIHMLRGIATGLTVIGACSFGACCGLSGGINPPFTADQGLWLGILAMAWIACAVFLIVLANVIELLGEEQGAGKESRE